MPTSTNIHIIDVLNDVIKLQPKSILDIGIGFGKWGMLFREYLDISGKHNISKDSWQVKIDGVEIFQSYIQPHQLHIYNNIFIGNIIDIADKLSTYDLIFMSDVIEHLDKSDGVYLIDTLISKSKTLMICSPLGKWHQGPSCGNDYEAHISEWNIIDFSTFVYKLYNIGDKKFGKFISV